jgi:hypothetical protein
MKTSPSKRTLRGLAAVNFLMADVHTGVGPFVAIYLARTESKGQRGRSFLLGKP